MKLLHYAAMGVAAAWPAFSAQAQESSTQLAPVNVEASQQQEPNWKVLRETEPRVRPIGAEPDHATLDTSASQHITVINQDELDMLGSMSMVDVLARVPGITVNQSGALNGTITVRGLNSNGFHVPMFIDGDRFRGRPVFQFMMLSPAEVQQVEVIRGPASVRYGSDGLSGLVNFVTKKPTGTLGDKFTFSGGEAGVTYRSNGNALQSDVSLEGAGDHFDLRVYGMGRTASDYSTPVGKVMNSDYSTAGGGIEMGYMPDATQRYEMSYRYGEIRDGDSNATTTANNQNRRAPLIIHQVRLGYEGTFDDWIFKRVDASLYGNFFESMLDTNVTSATAFTKTTSNVRGPNIFGGHASFQLPTTSFNLDTSFGVDFALDHWLGGRTRTQTTNLNSGAYTDTGFSVNGNEMSQTQVGVFGLTEWSVTKDWKLTAGARYDNYLSDLNITVVPNPNLLQALQDAKNSSTGALTGSLGTSYFLTKAIELTASYGNSFRMPWYSDMYSAGWNGSSYTIPNPDLKPEYSTTAEVGTRLHLPKAYVDLSVYSSNYRNFQQTLQTTYMGLPATQTSNVGKSVIRGFELSGKWQVMPRVNLHGSVSYTRGTNTITDTPLVGIAPWFGMAGVQYVGANDAWSASGEVQFAARKSRIDATQEYPVSGYGVINAYLQFQLDKMGMTSMKNTQLVLSVTNLFDKAYSSPSTTVNVRYPESMLNPLTAYGRSLNASLRMRF